MQDVVRRTACGQGIEGTVGRGAGARSLSRNDSEKSKQKSGKVQHPGSERRGVKQKNDGCSFLFGVPENSGKCRPSRPPCITFPCQLPKKQDLQMDTYLSLMTVGDHERRAAGP